MSLEEAKTMGAFASALALFQQQVVAPKENGHVSYKSTKYDYVMLKDLIKAINEGIKGTGLAWLQDTKTNAGIVSVRTIVFHKDGYQFESSWTEIKTSGKAQDVGSAMTYARRYSLSTTFGVNSETDDDGQSANDGAPQFEQANHNQQKLLTDLFNEMAKTTGKPAKDVQKGYLGLTTIGALRHDMANSLIKLITEQLEKLTGKVGDKA
ncbi:ERF family protein [Lactiplantibacillus paraplantarum]|uniref:ERF family protein n=1 Tax=Lactiplantibacillus paraplantarum TaxID=60520 RepID=UPI0021CF54B2|nr:ERF family protein [Lactiplantibacillus paraplantarum]MCU4683134.1 ERF family protein [Lactiplantibacillus paraplantarum]